jgi:hypothetical protein
MNPQQSMSVLGGAARAVTLAPVVTAFNPATSNAWETVASWNAPDAGQPIPMEVRLDVTSYMQDAIFGPTEGDPAVGAFPGAMVHGLCGQMFTDATDYPTCEPTIAAAWRITYGAGGERRSFICDLRSGRYPLGACTSVTVEAIRWRASLTVSSAAPTIQASAAILPAAGTANDEPTVTIVRSVSSGGGFASRMVIPPHARWFTPMFDGTAGDQNFWGGTNPDLIVRGFGEAIIVSPANSTIVPLKHRYEIGLPFSDTSELSLPYGYIRTAVDEAQITEEFQVCLRFWLAI